MSAIDTSLLKPELVFFDFEADDRFDFFKKLGEKLKEGGYVKDSWLDAILEREKNYPTGLECTSISVALPHVDPENLIKPYIAIIKPTPLAKTLMTLVKSSTRQSYAAMVMSCQYTLASAFFALKSAMTFSTASPAYLTP